MTKTPTQKQYEDALEVVQQYENRQKDLAKLNNDLGYCLQQFNQVKFDVNEDKKEVTFTGVTKAGKLKLTKSIARSGDKFEPVIGKLICVKKALNEDVEYIDKFVERVENTVWVCNSHNTLPTEVQTDDIWNNMIKKSRRRGLVID